MVLVRVGEHDAGKVSPLFQEIADVGIDQIDARKMLFAGERDPEINDNPAPAILLAEPVNCEIHPDLADTTQGREHKLVTARVHSGFAVPDASAAGGRSGSLIASRGKTSPAAIVAVV